MDDSCYGSITCTVDICTTLKYMPIYRLPFERKTVRCHQKRVPNNRYRPLLVFQPARKNILLCGSMQAE